MSKKNKQKFKKLIKAQINQQMNQVQTATPAISPVISQTPAQNVVTDNKTTVAPAENQHLDQVKYDLKKTGILIGSMIIVIIGLYFTNSKTDILLNFGNQIFKVLNIK